ncbi:MAG: HK97 family phage prohead protease [Vicinamibacterales bacterium]
MTQQQLTTKGLGPLAIKDEAKGEVEAVIATLDVADRDGDIIRRDAITSGAKVKVSKYGHDAMWGAQPVGKGTIEIDGNKAVFKGRLFLDTNDGRDTFTILKEMGADQEWSFGFVIKGTEVPDEDLRKQGVYRILTKLEPFEVSPVMIGAGVGTRTTRVKQLGDDGDPGNTPEPETDGDPPPEPPAVEPPNAEAAAQQAADEAKAAADAEAKAAAEAEVARLQAQANEEFARFQRTMRRFATL